MTWLGFGWGTHPGFACAPDVVGNNGEVPRCGSVDACRRYGGGRVARNGCVCSHRRTTGPARRRSPERRIRPRSSSRSRDPAALRCRPASTAELRLAGRTLTAKAPFLGSFRRRGSRPVSRIRRSRGGVRSADGLALRSWAPGSRGVGYRRGRVLDDQLRPFSEPGSGISLPPAWGRVRRPRLGDQQPGEGFAGRGWAIRRSGEGFAGHGWAIKRPGTGLSPPAQPDRDRKRCLARGLGSRRAVPVAGQDRGEG
ncbi:hypothetical protein CLV67_11768 [Actinoplanes italicus]|uniref:Uncharacterized protein n=1 Tax=Actinoplanes italicus TaxID=113567 RepID=A0A2T0K2G5_9ACTN|nr:hypothetical protein CLV67_11768 [Actinoplanes italicus]